ncbi:MAG: septum formation protein Maf [Candidatus Omnitrophica bacterium]|nr:septum formation protein Maf [Candidatus Omnitrophota bacterium]
MPRNNSRPRILLASQSPRRKRILNEMQIPHRVVQSDYAEKNPRRYIGPARLTLRHAVQKAKRARIGETRDVWVLGADTVVYFEGRCLGKPRTRLEAFRTLRRLSGKWHSVYSAVALWHPAKMRLLAGYCKTRVRFKDLTDSEIRFYLSKVNPLDKAGSYAIQEGPGLVQKMRGSHSNVVGMPVELLSKMLRQAFKKGAP